MNRLTLAARLALLAVFLSIPVLSGCKVNEEYVAADRATYEELAPDTIRGIQENPDYDADMKIRMLRTVRTWEFRIRKAEGK